MNKIQNLLWAIIIASPTVVMAQPPEEELSPSAPEFNIEVMDAPAPAEAAPVVTAPVTAPTTGNAQLQPILSAIPMAPIGEPKKLEDVKEDQSLKGLTLSPAITLKPLGYNGERHQTFFEINPSAGLSTIFKTPNKRDVEMNVSYGFTWDEFLSRRDTAAARYFEHDLSGDVKIDWTKSFATKMTGNFNYSLWASTSREFAIISDETISGIFKINSDLSLSTGYHLFYFNDLDTRYNLSDGTLPSDIDDLRIGNSAFSGSGGDPLDPNNPTVNFDPTIGNNWSAQNGVQLGANYKAGDTTLAMDYEYVFLSFTNDENSAWTGHWIVPSLSQKLPWKGGTVAIRSQLRLRNYSSKSNDDGSLVSNLRNRTRLTISQAITDTISTEFYYRWAISGSNADNYAQMENEHQMNLGFTFAF